MFATRAKRPEPLEGPCNTTLLSYNMGIRGSQEVPGHSVLGKPERQPKATRGPGRRGDIGRRGERDLG